jgi:hypothetical protein
MTDQPHGPIYEYMMGTFDISDASWMSSMNDMLNNFGLAGWRKSVAAMLDARHLLLVMERRFPSVAEYPRPERVVTATGREPAAVPDAEVTEFLEEFGQPQLKPDAREIAAAMAAKYRASNYRAAMDADAQKELAAANAAAAADEYDAEGEALMAARVAEVMPWARQPKVPANGRRKGVRGPQRKKPAAAVRNKAVT